MDLNFYRFIESWHVNLRGPKTTRDLLGYAEMFGVTIKGETARARETSLGKLIKTHVGQVVEFNGNRMVIQSRLLEGKSRYEVHRAEGA